MGSLGCPSYRVRASTIAVCIYAMGKTLAWVLIVLILCLIRFISEYFGIFYVINDYAVVVCG